MISRARLVLLVAQWIGLTVASTAALAVEPTPTVSIPPAVGFPFDRAAVDLASFDYTEQEFFISGTAQAFVNSGTLGNDGVWNVSPGETAPYTTRILVRTPTDPARFNGTVVVEWLNVSGGVDAAAEWDYSHVELLRGGYAWVGVTAQFDGAAFLPHSSSANSARYASIFHPGDSWSYDIYSQAGMAILHGNPRPLGNLTPFVRAVLAEGESQSASRMFTYYNAIEPLARVYQGVLIHSTGSGSALSQSTADASVPAPPGVPATPNISVPPTAFIRGDLPQPVLFFNTETDITVLGAGFSVHNQPDSKTFRMWEVAGTTHADAYLLQQAQLDAEASGLVAPPFDCGNPPDNTPLNNGPETFALRTAVHALALWTRVPELKPSIAPRFSVQIVTPPPPAAPAALIDRDPATGLAIGGIRLPQVAVPIETLTGIRPPVLVAASPFCVLFGAASPWDGGADPWDGVPGVDPAPFPAPSLTALYGTKLHYLEQYGAAIGESVFHGFLLPRDILEEFQLAAEANVPNGAASNAAILPNP
jgi:alpha/beta hydrolase family protein